MTDVQQLQACVEKLDHYKPGKAARHADVQM